MIKDNSRKGGTCPVHCKLFEKIPLFNGYYWGCKECDFPKVEKPDPLKSAFDPEKTPVAKKKVKLDLDIELDDLFGKLLDYDEDLY